MTLSISGANADLFELVGSGSTRTLRVKQGAVLNAVNQPVISVNVSNGIFTVPVTVNVVNNIATLPTVNALNFVFLGSTQTSGVTLSNSNLSSSDGISTTSQITYSVSSLNGCYFELISSGSQITSFTQAQINSSAIRFRFFTPTSGRISFNLVVGGVEGQSSPQAVNVNIIPVISFTTEINNARVSHLNDVQFYESYIQLQDADNPIAQQTFTVLSTSNGNFKKSGLNVTSFTGADLAAGLIFMRGVANSSGFFFNIRTADIYGNQSTSITKTIPGELVLTLGNSLIISSSGGTVAVTSAIFSASTLGSSSGISYQVANGTNEGTPQIGQPSNLTFKVNGSASTSFTHTQLSTGQVTVTFTGTGSPGTTIIVATNGTDTTDAEITVLTRPAATVVNIPSASAAGTTVTNAMINCVDWDSTTAQLTWSVLSITSSIQFRKSGVGVTSFTQQEIDLGQIKLHSTGVSSGSGGSSGSNSFTLRLTDNTGLSDVIDYTDTVTLS